MCPEADSLLLNLLVGSGLRLQVLDLLIELLLLLSSVLGDFSVFLDFTVRIFLLFSVTLQLLDEVCFFLFQVLYSRFLLLD